MIVTGLLFEVLVYLNHLMQLSAQEDFIEFSHHESFLFIYIYINPVCCPKIYHYIHKFNLAVVLYGCKSWSVTLQEESRQKVFKNRVLRNSLA